MNQPSNPLDYSSRWSWDGSRRAIGIVRRRESAPFLICDAEMRVLYASPELDSKLALEALPQIAPLCHDSLATNATLYYAYDDESVLRVVPLGTKLAGCVAIFVDTFNTRGSVGAAALSFGLTKRETQVLRLMVGGSTTEKSHAFFSSRRARPEIT
jgi:hypothetical protein